MKALELECTDVSDDDLTVSDSRNGLLDFTQCNKSGSESWDNTTIMLDKESVIKLQQYLGHWLLGNNK